MGANCLSVPQSPIHFYTIPISNHHGWQNSSIAVSFMKTEETNVTRNQRQWFQSKGFLKTRMTIYYVDLPVNHLVSFNSHTDSCFGLIELLEYRHLSLPIPSALCVRLHNSREVHRFELSDYRENVYFVLTNKALLSFNPQNQFLTQLQEQRFQLKVFCCCLHKKKKRVPLVLLKLVASFFFV